MIVKLRPLQISDAYVSVNWRNDRDVFKYTGNTYDHAITIDSELEWIKRVIINEDERRFAIIADGKYVGNIYLTNIKDGNSEYHIFIGEKDYWGKGVASAASRLLIEFGFKDLKLRTIELGVRPQNLAAVRLYQHLGFRYSNDGEINDKGLVRMYLSRDNYLNQIEANI